jgi:hypothetical protein
MHRITFTKQSTTMLFINVILVSFTSLLFGCNTSEKDGETKAAVTASTPSDEVAATWTVTIRGAVKFPEAGGQILIQEVTDNMVQPGFKDTIQLKSNSTYEKRMKLTEPGYYKLNFYNRQILTIILDRADLEVNVDGNNAQGFYEVKGSPDLDLIGTVKGRMESIDNSPEVTKINQEYQTAYRNQDAEKIAKLQADYMAVVGKAHEEVAAYLEKQPLSLGLLNLLQANTIDKDKYFKTYLSVAEK